ncbi:DUF4232 domain-containing protein [Streptomyces sp. WG7]|uniref:DUF4232 domain-containing protein n=1 Tax=Streptomyces sp. WG7 TaxID=3417650 RepID=UPI003CE7CEC4
MRIRKLTFAALAVAAGLTLTACNGEDGTVEGAGAPAPTASSAGGGSEQGGEKDAVGKSAGGSGSGVDTRARMCRTDDLVISASDNTADGASVGSVAVTFKNRGGRACTLTGYAGVDLKTNVGNLSANRSGQQANPVILKDGTWVSFGISYPINNSGGSGVRVTGLMVTPPNETKTVSLAWPGAPTLPATNSTASSVKVGPIGSAGRGGAN